MVLRLIGEVVIIEEDLHVGRVSLLGLMLSELALHSEFTSRKRHLSRSSSSRH